MADLIDQTFGPDGRERFNSNRPPICYLGKVVAGPNIGLPLTSSAASQGGPNNDVPIERADVAVPAGTVLVAVTGDKIPTRFSVHPPSGRAYFDGTRAGSCTFYCFGFYNKQPAPAGSGYVDEQYDRNGKMIWDHQTIFMRPAAGNTTARITVPAGRVWAGVAVGFTVNDNYRTIGQNTYRRFYYSGIYTDATGIETRALMVDVQRFQTGSGEEPTGTVYRRGSLFAVDVTGY